MRRSNTISGASSTVSPRGHKPARYSIPRPVRWAGYGRQQQRRLIMTQVIARYATSSGLAGCYMPDSQGGPYEFTTRRELANYIRQEIEYMDWLASMFAQVGIRRLWSAIQSAGSSSSYHFSLQHNGYELAFHGLTKEEAIVMEEAY